MRRIWQSFGLRRSGAHLVADWILSEHGGFMVNLAPATRNKLLTGSRTWRSQTNDPEGPDVVFVWEDFPLDDCGSGYSLLEAKLYGEIDGDAELAGRYIVVRDIYNLAASRIRLTQNYYGYNPVYGWRSWVTDLWKSYARAAIQMPQFAVLFEKFVGDEAYRAHVAKRFGVPQNDAVLSVQCSIDGFSRLRRGEIRQDPEASLHRRTMLATERPPEAEALLNDAEAAELNAQLFGPRS